MRPGIGAIRAPALGTGRNCRPRSGIGWRELPLPEEEMQNFRQLVQPLYRKYCADYLPLVEEIQAE
jgi:hypothetical protein